MVHSGDVVVMGGRSRTYIHGVPRIFKGTFHLSDQAKMSSLVHHSVSLAAAEESCYKKYATVLDRMQGRRINISIRQVHSVHSNLSTSKEL